MGNIVSEILRRRPSKIGMLCGKIIYPSKEKAVEVMHTVVREKGPRHLRKGKRLKRYPSPYFCEGCQGWHWGHSSLNPVPTSMLDFYGVKPPEGSSELTSPRCEEA